MPLLKGQVAQRANPCEYVYAVFAGKEHLLAMHLLHLSCRWTESKRKLKVRTFW